VPWSSTTTFAVKDSLYTAGRRGVGGTVLVEEDRRRGGEARRRPDAVVALCEG
jgi:hypothetical protein